MRRLTPWLGVFFLSFTACAEFAQSLQLLGLPAPAGLTQDQIAAGLKEALRIGTGHATALTGKPDGYYRNPSIRIPMPEQLQAFEKGLRVFGFGPQVDEFVLSMNRAAERAAPQAAEIFVGAIAHMTFADAQQILSGPDTAATAYFKAKTSAQLTAAFRPHVEQAMNQVGVTRQYKELAQRFRTIPLAKPELVDLDQYVVGKGLEGLFLMLGQEEQAIRKNPAARVTDILKQVFGKPS
ncbi:MAG: hypothetical protein RL768_639 [Nitrospirota bacterium]